LTHDGSVETAAGKSIQPNCLGNGAVQTTFTYRPELNTHVTETNDSVFA
jgi:hypothetical protein